jgi:hypothetical protein
MNPGRIKPLWALLFFALSLALLNRLNQLQVSQDPRHQLPFPDAMHGGLRFSSNSTLFTRAWQQRLSGVQLSMEGKISRVFSAGETDAGQQKFVLQLAQGQSVTVIHDATLGAAIEGLAVGETIEVSGEYHWTADGGIMRWTHRNPEDNRQAGWVNYKGRLYR